MSAETLPAIVDSGVTCGERWRRVCQKFSIGIVAVVCIVGHAIAAEPNNDKPLDFGFIKNPPGEFISLRSHRLHVDCRGKGDVTVLLETGLGGSSLEWIPIQEKLLSRAVVCLYDRAGYAWSDPSPDSRNARQLAWDAHQMLTALKVNGPLVLVGHSFGGFIVRMLAEHRKNDLIGMVLVDASHEDQIDRFEKLGGPSVMPKNGKSFVLSTTGVPENLPESIRVKIAALGRMRKTYNATHGEMAEFRESARQVRLRRRRLDVPLTVLSRGIDPYGSDAVGQEKSAIWTELQNDLVTMSSQGQLVVAAKSGHHVHVDEPDLVVDAIETLINDYEKE